MNINLSFIKDFPQWLIFILLGMLIAFVILVIFDSLVTFSPRIQSFLRSVKNLFNEILDIYSDKPSRFSKKRIESGIGFLIAEYGMLKYLNLRLAQSPIMPIAEFLIWATAQFAVAGYIINEIQKEKKLNAANQTDKSVN